MILGKLRTAAAKRANVRRGLISSGGGSIGRIIDDGVRYILRSQGNGKMGNLGRRDRANLPVGLPDSPMIHWKTETAHMYRCPRELRHEGKPNSPGKL
ncbi:hypothetical protein VTO73DRAFT_2972 [Trametes versicolor]